MSSIDSPPEELALEILHEHEDINPLLSDVVENIRRLRTCGLSDSKIRDTIPGMFRVTEKAAEEGALSKPSPEEIRVISLPTEYQRSDWT